MSPTANGAPPPSGAAAGGSVVGHVAAVGAERTPLLGPVLHAAGHRVGVEPRATERLRGHERAPADAADEDDRAVGIELGRGGRELVELDVLRALDVARLALVRLADVDDARARVGEGAGGLLGADFESLGHALTR